MQSFPHLGIRARPSFATLSCWVSRGTTSSWMKENRTAKVIFYVSRSLARYWPSLVTGDGGLHAAGAKFCILYGDP
jgi:hypothetical protein